MTPEQRDELLTAALDLHAATLTPDSPDRPSLVALRRTTPTLARRLSDERIVGLLTFAMREATETLGHVAELEAPDGAIHRLFRDHASLVAQAEGLARSRANQSERKNQRAAEARKLEAANLSRNQIAVKMGVDRATVRRWLGKK